MSVYYCKRGRERECVRLQEREREHIEQQSRPQQQSTTQQNTVKVAATAHSPAVEHNTTSTMASRKHERSESR